MGYWQSKVLPKIKKVFENKTKTAAAEATKSFDDSKVDIDKEFDEKKTELQPRVLEIYEAAPAGIKTLVKEPTSAGVKKNSAAVVKFLEELDKIEFPGSKKVSEIATSFGPALVPTPILFLLEKVSTSLPAEENAAEPEEKAAVEESSGSKDRELAVAAEEEKKEEETAAAPADAAAPAGPAKPAEEAPKA